VCGIRTNHEGLCIGIIIMMTMKLMTAYNFLGGMRMLIEQTYKDARGMSLQQFWDDILHHKDTKPLVCETYVQRIQTSLGLTDEEESSSIADLGEENEEISLDLDEEKQIKESPATDESPSTEGEPMETMPSEVSSVAPSSDVIDEPIAVDEESSEKAVEPLSTTETTKSTDPQKDEEETDEDLPLAPLFIHISPYSLLKNGSVRKADLLDGIESTGCCFHCPCHKNSTEFSILGRTVTPKGIKAEADADVSYPFCLSRSTNSKDKMGQRVQQIAHILRNLSFESDNASIMGKNSTLLRYE
jgi:hypothetical protein